MSQKRSPVLGYNHNILHLGWALHIQTEDSGVSNPHIFTHLFHNGTILASKKLVYDVSSAPEFVRDLMQAQHKAVLREVKNGVHDDHIRKMLGEPPAKPEASPPPSAATPEPATPASSSLAPTTESVPPGQAAPWQDNASLPPKAKELVSSTQLEWNDGSVPAAPAPPAPPAPAPAAKAEHVSAINLIPIDAVIVQPPVTPPPPAPPPPSTPASTTARAPTPLPPNLAPSTAEGHHTVDVGSSWILRGKVREEVFPVHKPEPGRSPTPASAKRPGATTTASMRAVVATQGKAAPLPARTEAGVAFSTGQELVDSYFPGGESGGITLDQSFLDLQLGQDVLLKIRVETLAMGFELKARVAWKRPRSSGALKAGVGAEFLAVEKPVVDRLLALCKASDPDAADRRHARVNAELPVKLAHKSANRKERASDISEGGLFIKTDELLPIGDEVTLTLKPPRALLGGFDVRGKVTWHRDAPPKGFGVMFLFDNPAQKTRVEQLLTRLNDE